MPQVNKLAHKLDTKSSLLIQEGSAAILQGLLFVEGVTYGQYSTYV